MALQTLRHKKPYKGKEGTIETKRGAWVYGGEASEYHTWEFRSMVRYDATKEEEKHTLGAIVLEGLYGEAFEVAMEFGRDKIGEKEGVPKLIEHMKSRVFPHSVTEAKELWHVGQQVGGILARQSGERMVAYTTRRKKWYDLLTKLDPKTTISENILVEMLLDNARITAIDKQFIKTATKDSTDWKIVVTR